MRLRVDAPAVDGKANRACIRFLAEALGVPRRQVELVRGETSRDKVVRIREVPEQRVRALREQWGL